jgi:hypothetical protein
MRLHPAHRCAWCGNDVPGELKQTTHKDTRAPALVCRDPIECCRRQLREKTKAAA